MHHLAGTAPGHHLEENTLKTGHRLYTIVIACIAAGLSACAGPNGDVTGTDTTTAAAFPGVTAYLSIDPTRLANYAAASFPAYYDAAVFQQLDNSGANPITNAGATLGHVLFFDKRLSINNTVSCASCHIQVQGFTDTARLSLGFDGVGRTGSHAMRLGNARFFAGAGFFWDRRAATLEIQATQPIQNSVEMGFDAAHGGLDSLFRKMRALPYYPELFRLVYGDTAITEIRIQRAIAQYVRSIASVSSRWDDGYAQVYNPALPDRGLNTPVPGLTAEENRGRQLFIQPPPQGGAGCAGCHLPPTYSLAANSLSNGLDAGETRIFKSPSLKGVAVAGPYMHDGRFATLDEVVAHYDTGIQAGPALDNRLRGPQGQPLRLNLTAADRAALVAFMRTLTDTRVTADPRFTDPFIR